MSKEQTTVSVWRETLRVLDRVCAVNRRTRQEQMDFFCALEALRLEIHEKKDKSK